jgi:uncharacterized protein (TIRG00374 family)
LSGARSERRAIADWRVWLGFAVTALALVWTLRDVPFSEVVASLGSVSPWWAAMLVPWHLVGMWARALRWRWLAGEQNGALLPLGALYDSTVIGFMALNLFPLRLGELVRPWFLARQTGIRASAALGTLVLERAFDFTTVAAIGGVVLFLHARAMPEWVRLGAGVLLAIGLVPFLLVLALRRNEAGTLRVLGLGLRLLPGRASKPLEDVLAQVCQGLVALRGARAVTMVTLHSLVLWGVWILLPFTLGLVACGIELPPGRALHAASTAMVFTALAIAAPAAPGFFGVYHFACREALVLFGVPTAAAVAYGTLVHMTYWAPVTLAGLLALARSGSRMRDLWSAAR